jgi:hypothetical protein
MRPISASALLEIWERGEGRKPVEQALAILGLVCPELSSEVLENLTIGQRDAYLIKVRSLTFGTRFTGVVTCPDCGEPLEMIFDVRDLLPNAMQPGALEPVKSPKSEATLFIAPYQVTYRLPTSADLGVVSQLEDPIAARQQLLEACVLKVERGDEVAHLIDLPKNILEKVTEQMHQTEPMANISLRATCPACRHQWQVLFDIVSFLWGEINAWAVRLLREVHILASAYGWSEKEILDMSALRRQQYLEMIGS